MLTGSLISRELYLRPETRSVENVDILISENDLNNVDNILQSLGYVKFPQEVNKKDVIFVNKNMSIRVRWTLINDSFIEVKKLLFKEVEKRGENKCCYKNKKKNNPFYIGG